MGTPALIDLNETASPTGDPLRVRVHYDGDDYTRRALETLIARDGMDVVAATFAAQASRFWVGLNPDLKERPAYVDTYPPDWKVEAIPGYGLLFVGDDEISKSHDPTYFDTADWTTGFWRVTSSGTVHWAAH